MSNPNLTLNPQIAADALVLARSSEPDLFRKSELAWLEANNAFAHTALTDFFASEIAKRQDNAEETAKAGYQGALLGSFMLRGHTERNYFPYDIVKANNRQHFSGHNLVFDRVLQADELDKLLGQSLGAVVEEVSHATARTLCGVVLSLSITEKPVEIIEDFLRPKKLPTPKRKRQASGGSSR
jgi:hypothetical protein